MVNPQAPEVHPLRTIRQIDAEGNQSIVNITKFKYGNQNASITGIKNKLTQLSDKLKKDGINGKIQVSILTDFGWRTGKMNEIGDIDEDNIIWNPATYYWTYFGEMVMVGNEEQSKNKKGHTKTKQSEMEKWYNDKNTRLSRFNIFVLQEVNEGGTSDNKYNDCLYNSLVKLFGEHITDTYPKASSIKRALKICRADCVNTTTHLNFLEKKLNINFNVVGDVVRTSKNNHKLTCNLVLQNGHYTIQKEKVNNKKATNISYKPRIPLFYSFDNKKQLYKCYTE